MASATANAIEECCSVPEKLSIDANVFRAYDIRGVVDQNLTVELAYMLGRVFGSLAIEQNRQEVVVARDGRLTGEKLKKSLTQGLCDAGVDVIDLGMVPTPILYFGCEHFQTHTGIMITGSHNPVEYNGFKMVLNGVSLAESDIQNIYQRIIAKDFESGHGQVCEKNIINDYLAAITQRIKLKRPLKVVMDCGNGVVGTMAERLAKALGVEFIGLYCDVDGTFPNHHPDPGQPQNMKDLQKAVLANAADCGLAFDGDGDRLGIVDNTGQIVWPDKLMMLFVEAVLAKEPNTPIIYDVKCTHHLGELIEQCHGQPVMYKTGHSLIKRKMKELKAPLAGEMSGHFFFKHRWYGFDDACFSAAILLEILANRETPETLSNLIDKFPKAVNTPEINIQLADQRKFSFIEELKNLEDFKEGTAYTIDGLRVAFAKGWGLVRASNTTPTLVCRFEANDEAELYRIQALFKRAMLKVEPGLTIPF